MYSRTLLLQGSWRSSGLAYDAKTEHVMVLARASTDHRYAVEADGGPAEPPPSEIRSRKTP